MLRSNGRCLVRSSSSRRSPLRDWEPKAAVWNEIDFNGGQEAVYNVPWVPITLENVDALLEEREALTTR